jgi:hypothetical protein
MHRKYWVAGVAATLVTAAALIHAQEDKDVPATSLVIAFVQSGQDGSKALEKDVIAPLRKEYEDKDVLFIVCETAKGPARNQSRLLLEALGYGEVWRANAGKPGTAVLVSALTGDVVKSFTAKDGAKAVMAEIEKARMPADEGCDGGGCDGGCGCEGCG